MNKTVEKLIIEHKDKKPPWGPLGYITYKRTYSRPIYNRTEEWHETVGRCVNGIYEIRPSAWPDEVLVKLYDYIFNMKCMFAGRSLWQLGTDTVARFGGDSLQNCWAVAVNDAVKPFCFAFDELMLGGGVGFNITPEQVYSMPPINFKPKIQREDSDDVDFIVPDNREGWVKLLSKILKRYFYTGKDMKYSTRCIRSKGKLIKSFGGVASGSEILVQGMNSICTILNNRYGKKLRPIDCLDIMNIIGSVVVSGNIRRSAEIALGGANDSLFLNAKNWNIQQLPEWRRMSNNSIIAGSYEDIPIEFWEGYNGNGEAYGIVNLEICKNYGRLSDNYRHRTDDDIIGVNPCAEITLESYEACNLADIFLPNIDSYDEFSTAIQLMHRVCKTIATLPFIHPETEKVVRRNQRIGISVSGFMQSKWRCDVDFFMSGYSYLEYCDKTLSKDWGINE